jgi:hypothetical protein
MILFFKLDFSTLSFLPFPLLVLSMPWFVLIMERWSSPKMRLAADGQKSSRALITHVIVTDQ